MKTAGLVSLGVVGILLLIAINLGLAVLFVFMFIWNISDIQNVGPNFWNIFWLVIATLGSLSMIGGAFRNK